MTTTRKASQPRTSLQNLSPEYSRQVDTREDADREVNVIRINGGWASDPCKVNVPGTSRSVWSYSAMQAINITEAVSTISRTFICEREANRFEDKMTSRFDEDSVTATQNPKTRLYTVEVTADRMLIERHVETATEELHSVRAIVKDIFDAQLDSEYFTAGEVFNRAFSSGKRHSLSSVTVSKVLERMVRAKTIKTGLVGTDRLYHASRFYSAR